MAAVAVILLGQPAFARGGGFGGGFGGGSHGFGGFGVHGFGGGYTPSMHGGGESSMSGNRPLAGADQDHPNTGDKPVSNQPANDSNHQYTNNNSNNFNHYNDNNVTNNFDGNRGWVANHPYEAFGAADYASHHNYPYAGYNYAAYPYGYYGGAGVFPEFPLVIDNNTTTQQPQAATQSNNPPAQAAPLAVAGQTSTHGVNNSAAASAMPQ